ncbi:lysozyme [Lysobacter sp. HA35]
MSRPVYAGAALSVLALAGAIVAQWEGVKYAPYRDSVGVLTVCYGHTGPDVREGTTYTPEQCDALLQADMAIARAAVNRCLPMPKLVQVEAALDSLTFNVGPVAVCGEQSTIRRKALANDWPGACAAIDLYNKAGGREYRGLTLRRGHERAVCERGAR